MEKYLLNQSWEYVESNLQNPLLVGMLQGWKKTNLPHDYSIEKGRDIHSPAGLDEGFFQGAGLYYKKSFVLKEAAAGKRVWLEFEGVFGITEVWVNKKFAAKHTNPYTGFAAEITGLVHEGENEITLHCDSRMKPCSRWYVGTGLCRDVWLHVGERVCITPHGLRCVTKSLEGNCALLSLSADITAPVDSILYELVDRNGTVVAFGEGSELIAKNITPWSVETPYLYTLRATVISNGVSDVTEETVGIRTIQVNPRQWLLLNGRPIKLKGGCIHHDLGLLGAADHEAAEKRRIRLLKQSGFNAVRLAHNPFGPAVFKACDELGMLCIEEAFDEWVLGRTSFGLHISFEDRWEKDLKDMILRDFNHPSIIMWSTGNEVEERDGSADGYAWAKRLAEKVKALDASRPVSASACALFSEYGQRPADGTTGNQALNMAYDGFAEGRDLWGPATAPYFAPLDVAGYNYKSVRYAHDGKIFPDRVIYGSESYPRDAYQTWRNTEENSHVIGDFVWTAWDYLGEVGVGRWEISDAPRPGNPAWPWMTAGCADIDLIGCKRPQSFYRDMVWGNEKGPRLFCLPPQLTGKHLARLSWGWLPVEENYTFPGQEGQSMEAHVYADAEEVELLQNGVSLGKLPCQKYEAVFTLSYRPGELTAVAYIQGQEIGRDTLATCGSAVKLSLSSDSAPIADGRDLCFVSIQALDAQGRPVYTECGEVTLSVQGGTLLALGNADPKPDRAYPFTESTCPLYHGKALAVIRSTLNSLGCLVNAEFHGSTASLPIDFAPIKELQSAYIGEPSVGGAMDLPLGELMANEKALTVLRRVLGPMLDSPMIGAMKGMSLRKLLSMGGQSLPASVEEALNQAVEG